MTMFRDRDTQIGTLKVRGIRENTHRSALFRRLSFLLNTVDFKPPGIPPPGILIIRRMEDPLPGKVTPCGQAVRVETAWEKAAQQVLNEKYRSASRPVNGRIPNHADAVFFEDESQLLAVLLLDIVNGDVPNRWWWKIALKGFDSLSNLVKLLCGKITLLPAIFSHLAAWGAAPRVIKKLSEEDSLTVITALAGEFHLEEAAAPLLAPGKSTGVEEKSEKGDRPHPVTTDVEKQKGDKPHSHPPPGEIEIGDRSHPGGGGEIGDRPHRPHPAHPPGDEKGDRPHPGPWSQWMPLNRVPAYLAVPQVALLGLSLSLFYAPTKTRTPAFARAFHQWWEFCVQTGAKQTRTTAEDTASRGPGKEKFTAPSAKGKRKKEDKGRIGSRIRFDTHPQKTAEPTGHETPGHNEPALPPTETEESIAPDKPAAVKEKTLSLPEEGVETRLGGVFYLVNLMEYLDLPACFEEQCQLESWVGAWGTLELLARGLLEDQSPGLQSDPLWEVLARLDNREKGTLPGEDFYYTGDYTLPERWKRKFEIRSTKFETNSNDQNSKSETMALRGDLLNNHYKNTKKERANQGNKRENDVLNFDHLNFEFVSNFEFRASDFHIHRWVCFVLPYIRHYLRRIVKRMLFTNARLYVTATHVDVVMSLEDISLPVRMAGLDRDPGWLPQFARVILFHFQ